MSIRLVALSLALVACAADPTPPADTGPLDTAPMDTGVAPWDTGTEATVDTGWPDTSPLDTGALDGGVDAPVDTAPTDTGVDVDPRRSEVCLGVTAECDGHIVDVQAGERRPDGRWTHCGGCGITCAAGEGCLTCVCVRL